MESEFIKMYELIKPFTMVSIERLYATYQAVKYIEANNIPGDIVECGVWKGGCSMLMALSLESTVRELYLYDTFEGMPKPSEVDGVEASKQWKKGWCYSAITEVKYNMSLIDHSCNIQYVKGMVQDTIPGTIPGKIAVLRLDTDWYNSTLHELIHLYPLLSKGGVLLLDDYGYWKGQRDAADEYFGAKKPLMHRPDYAGRTIVK